MRTHLEDPNLRLLIVAVLVNKLGREVTITQDDIDQVAYNQLIEEGKEDGSLVFRFVPAQRSPS